MAFDKSDGGYYRRQGRHFQQQQRRDKNGGGDLSVFSQKEITDVVNEINIQLLRVSVFNNISLFFFSLSSSSSSF